MTEKNNIHAAIEYYLSVMNFRAKVLFSYFFVEGYTFTQLSSVASEHKHDAFCAKMYLGMLITLIDDLADNPKCFNPHLLTVLYANQPLRDQKLSERDSDILKLKEFLLSSMNAHSEVLPNYSELAGIFRFDLEKIYLSNKFSELITTKNFIGNQYEMKMYGSYTMGVLAAGMIDLMGIKEIRLEELGKCREVLIIGQRLSKIANTISTFAREKLEGDITNEIAHAMGMDSRNFEFHKRRLEMEFVEGINVINAFKDDIKTFDVVAYSFGIEKLFALNLSLIGTI